MKGIHCKRLRNIPVGRREDNVFNMPGVAIMLSRKEGKCKNDFYGITCSPMNLGRLVKHIKFDFLVREDETVYNRC